MERDRRAKDEREEERDGVTAVKMDKETALFQLRIKMWSQRSVYQIQPSEAQLAYLPVQQEGCLD